MVTTSTMLYVARTVDMFVSVRALTLKSIISTFVFAEELGKKLNNPPNSKFLKSITFQAEYFL